MSHQGMDYFVIYCGVILLIMIKAFWSMNGKVMMFEDVLGFMAMVLLIIFYPRIISYQL
jgi:hypothetical protein